VNERLVAEMAALPSYRGWTFTHTPAGYSFSHPELPYTVFFSPYWDGFFTPSWELAEGLRIRVQTSEGDFAEEYSALLPLPLPQEYVRKGEMLRCCSTSCAPRSTSSA